VSVVSSAVVVPAVRPPIRSHSIWSTAHTGAEESCVSSSSGVIA
jgi:hypothetical protein